MNDGKKINRIDSIFKDYVDNKFDYLSQKSNPNRDCPNEITVPIHSFLFMYFQYTMQIERMKIVL